MTLNLAWKSGPDVFLVVDSMLTYPSGGVPHQPFSSAGEAQPSGLNRVEELGAKLATLTSHVAASWCGLGNGALPALADLQTALRAGMGVSDALERLVRRYASSPPFTLLIASSMAGHPGLFEVMPSHPTTPIREIYEDHQPAFTGSLPNESRTVVERTLRSLWDLPEYPMSPGRTLVTAVMLLQAHGQHVDLASHGVGGAFFGARVGPNGVTFQDDLFYVLFTREDLLDNSYSKPRFLFTGVRDGRVLITWSTLTVQYKAFSFDIDYITEEEVKRCMDAVLDEFGRKPPLLAKYYGFIDRASGALVQVACTEQPPRHLFRVNGGNLQMLNAAFVEYLGSLPQPKIGEPLPPVPLVLCDDRP